MSGIELGRQLKALGRQVPIVFITANDDEATRREAMDVGYIAFLRKPFSAKVLIDAIAEIMG
jgi:FixJ family two-component response regulator